MYRRAPTLIEHQQLACDELGFQWLTGHHRRALVRVLREELSRTDNRERLLGFARRWIYEHNLFIVHERLLRSMIAAAQRQHQAQLAQQIDQTVEPSLMMRWRTALIAPHGAGSSALNEDQNTSQNQTLAHRTLVAQGEISPPTTVCYCTKNERTPSGRALEFG